MTVSLTGSGGLFTRLGKAFYAIKTLLTAVGSTIPAEVEDFLDEIATGSPEIRGSVAGVPAALANWQTGTDSLALTGLAESCKALLIRMVYEDEPQPSNDLESALLELIRQMTGAATVDASTAAVSVAAGGSNVGDGVCVVSAKRADGKNCQNALAEIVKLICGSASARSGTTPPIATFGIQGEVASRSKLSQDWPLGSGAAGSIAAVDASSSSNLVANGDMEDEDDRDNTPDDWIVGVGTIGTTLKMTNVEVQTITIAGTPTSGTYSVSWTNAASLAQTTEPLAYNASESDLQSALRKLKGLEQIDVSTSGSTPNFTHTITFTGAGGNVAQFTATNTFDTGTITPATSSAGSAYVYAGGKALEMDGNGSELTQIRSLLLGGSRVTTPLQPLTQYAVSLRALIDTYPAAGVMQVDLFDGNAVINDEAGTANSFTFNPKSGGDLGTEGVWTSITGVFRTPRNLPPVVYLRIHQTTAISSGSSLYLDHVAMTEMQPLYPDGPSVAVFSGATDFKAGSVQVEGDQFAVTVTNDRAGEFQEWFDRVFDMREKGLLLPSDSSGSETINDNLIA